MERLERIERTERPERTERDEAAFLVPVNAIVPGQNARRGWDAIDDRLKQLARSIEEQGLLEPLVVREVRAAPGRRSIGAAGAAGEAATGAGSEGRRFELLAGFRRYTAARYLGLTRVPVRVLAADDSDALAANLAENLARADLPEGDAVRVVEQLQETFGWGVRKIARSTGRSPAWISELLTVARSREEREAVEAGKIGINTAVRLARLKQASPEVRETLLERMRRGEQVLVSDVPRMEQMRGEPSRRRRTKARRLGALEFLPPGAAGAAGHLGGLTGAAGVAALGPLPEIPPLPPAEARGWLPPETLELGAHEQSLVHHLRLDVRLTLGALHSLRQRQGEDRRLPSRARDDLHYARRELDDFMDSTDGDLVAARQNMERIVGQLRQLAAGADPGLGPVYEETLALAERAGQILTLLSQRNASSLSQRGAGMSGARTAAQG